MLSTKIGNALTCKDVQYCYKNGTRALSGIDLELEYNKIHIILGPNGAGKTTFMRLATTELELKIGQMFVLGMDVKYDHEKLVKKIGVMPQQALLYKQLTAWEHTLYLTQLKGMSKKRSSEEAMKYLKMLDLFERKDEELYSFSVGMCNAISLVQAICGESELLFLDEPTVGLDPVRRRIIWDYLKQIKKEKTVILTTQYLDEAQELADTITVFHKGRIAHIGNLTSTFQLLGYKVKIELPKNEKTLNIAREIEKINYQESGDKIYLWVRDEKEALFKLFQSGIEVSSVVFHRPLLEEAYLNIVNHEINKKEKTL